MKHSIKKQIAGIFIALMTGTIGMCLLINQLFLERIYIKHKENAILSAFASINEATTNGDISSDNFDKELRLICDTYNISMIVIDASSNMIKSASNDSNILLRRLYDNVFNNDKNNPANADKKYLLSTENYDMATTYDRAFGTEYLEMWGVLDSGNLFLIRSPLESIRDSVEISTRFLMYIGVIATFISAIIIWILTTKITKPITQLSQISTKMINLDFETRYEGKGDNEVELLGAHMNQLADTLEKTISELKTANNELQKDIEKKEQIDEMRKEFLSNVSHELKTPLALIQGYAEGLKEGISQDEESRNFYCDVIMDEANKMNSMVKKLLDLNQLEFGNDVVTMERFDITSLVKNFVQSADILIKQNDVQVLLEEHEPIYVWADEFKTEEVFRNYFSNALNHVNEKKTVEIRYHLEDHKVRVSVFNTGDPIPEESLNRVWEKFYKVDKARTREYGGSGVGLSIVKAIMESMNQKYGVNNYQNGVEFWFELETK